MTDLPPPTRWLDADQQRSWRALVMGTTLLMDRLDDDLRREFDLSLVEYEILVRLSERDGPSAADGPAGRRAGPQPQPRDPHRDPDGAAPGSSCAPRRRRTAAGILCTMTERGYDLLVRVAPCTSPACASTSSTWLSRGLRGAGPGDERRGRPPGRRPPGDGDPLADAEPDYVDLGRAATRLSCEVATRVSRPGDDRDGDHVVAARVGCGVSRLRRRRSHLDHGGQSRVRRRCVTRCGRAASTPRRSILFSS